MKFANAFGASELQALTKLRAAERRRFLSRFARLAVPPAAECQRLLSFLARFDDGGRFDAS
jgi:hypothetical protein